MTSKIRVIAMNTDSVPLIEIGVSASFIMPIEVAAIVMSCSSAQRIDQFGNA